MASAIADIFASEASDQGLTQTAFGRMVGLSQSQIGRIWRLERTIDANQIVSFSSALGLDFVEVMIAARGAA